MKKLDPAQLAGNIAIAKYMDARIVGKIIKPNGTQEAAVFKPDELAVAAATGYFLQFTYYGWAGLMPVIEKISVDYDVTILWHDQDCSCYIHNRSIEETELVSYGAFVPDAKNVWLAIVALIKKEKLV